MEIRALREGDDLPASTREGLDSLLRQQSLPVSRAAYDANNLHGLHVEPIGDE